MLLQITRGFLYIIALVFLVMAIGVSLQSLNPPNIYIPWVGAKISLPPKYFVYFGIINGVASLFFAGAGEMITLKIDMARDTYYTANKLDQIASHIQDSLEEIHSIANHFDEKENNNNSEIPKWSP